MGVLLSSPGVARGVPQAAGLSHGGTEAAGGRAAGPWVRPSWLPSPFPRGCGVGGGGDTHGHPRDGVSAGWGKHEGSARLRRGPGETEAGPWGAPQLPVMRVRAQRQGWGPPLGGSPALTAPPLLPPQEFYPKKEPGFHLQAEDQEQLPGGGQPGHGGDGEGDTGVPQPPGAPWRDGRAGGLPAAPSPHPHTPPLSTAPPLLLPQPSVAAGGVWVGARPDAPHLPQRKPKDKRPAYQSLEPGSPPAPGRADPQVDRHYPTAPPCPPGGGCGALGPFDASGPDGDGPLGGDGGRFPCPPSIHTKLKKTWLTRHSEQSVPRCKGGRRDGPEGAGEGKRSAKRPHGAADGHRGAAEGAGAAKRGAKATERPGGTEHPGGTGSGGVPAERTELGEGGKAAAGGLSPSVVSPTSCQRVGAPQPARLCSLPIPSPIFQPYFLAPFPACPSPPRARCEPQIPPSLPPLPRPPSLCQPGWPGAVVPAERALHRPAQEHPAVLRLRCPGCGEPWG